MSVWRAISGKNDFEFGNLYNKNNNMNVRFAYFYADWCPNCESYRADWVAFKNEVDGKNIEGIEVECVEYDCTDPSDELESIMDKYEVCEYPSVKMVSNNPSKIETRAMLEPIMRYRKNEV